MNKLESTNEIRAALEESLDEGGLILHENELSRNFLDLSTGIAGELFQQFINYGQKLALVVADPGKYSPRLAELALEHKSHRLIRFFNDESAAEQWLQEEY